MANCMFPNGLMGKPDPAALLRTLVRAQFRENFKQRVLVEQLALKGNFAPDKTDQLRHLVHGGWTCFSSTRRHG